MKKCINCNKEYDDDKLFCPKCGISLTAEVAPGTSSTPTSSDSNVNLNTTGQPLTSAPDAPWYSQWKGAILAVIGLIIEWNWSVFFGMLLIGVGFILGFDSPNSGSKAVTVTLLVIGIILLLVFLIV